MWTRHLLLTCCALALSGCGLVNALSGVREPADTPPPGASSAAATPPLVAAPGGVSAGEAHELFLRPTSAVPGEPTLTGERYQLRAIDARPS